MSWAGTVPALGMKGIKAETLDLPGHGKALGQVGDGSLTALTEPVRDWVLEGEPAWLVGHSLGGGIAMKLALEHPEHVRGLVLLAPLGLGQALDVETLQAMTRIETVDEMQSFLGRLVADPSLIAPAIADYALSQLARAGAREALAVVSGQLRAAEEEIAELVPELAAREVPVTILWGAEDRMVSPDRARAEQFGPLVEIAGAGHIAHVEAAKVVNKLLAERLAP